jgi:hypothetical protein
VRPSGTAYPFYARDARAMDLSALTRKHTHAATLH